MLAFDPFGWILDLHGWVLLLVVFGLPALEASAFVGFVFPGEIAIVLGGVIASRGNASLPAVVFAAIAGAVIGDSVGYYVGMRWGRRMLDATLGRFVKQKHFDHAEAFLARRGGPAVFVGRWTAALRVLVPGLAGMAHLRFRTFLAYNVAGGAAWATTFVLLGYVAGDAYREVVDIAGRAGLLLFALIVVFGSVVFLSRWIARNPDRFREIRARVLRWRPLAVLRERAYRPLSFIVGRFRPGAAFGLSVTIGLVVIGLAGWAFGAIVRDVIGHEADRIDHPVARFFLQHREATLTGAMKAVTLLGSAPVLGCVALLVGGLWWIRRHTPRPLVLMLMAWAGSAALTHAIKAVIERPRPPAVHFIGSVSGSSFPSGHATHSVALYGMLAALLASATPYWTRKVAAWAGAVTVGLAVATTRLYLGVHWLSDVLGGIALGSLWLFSLLTTVRVIEGVIRDRREGRQPPPHGQSDVDGTSAPERSAPTLRA